MPNIQYFHVAHVQAIDETIRRVSHHKFSGSGNLPRSSKLGESGQPIGGIIETDNQAAGRFRIFQIKVG